MNVFHYLRLARFDVLLIAFFAYLFGTELADGTGLNDTIIALAVSLISTNFIYVFNSWTDRQIDNINKPLRPIPSGQIRPEHALIYSLILLIMAAVYPFFVFKSFFTLLLFLLMPFLGLIYSVEPIRLRNRAIPAVIVICTGLQIPMLLGYYMNASDNELVPFFIILYLYCLSVVPLKEIESVKEDNYIGRENLFAKYGHGLTVFSICGLSVAVIILCFSNISLVLKIFLFLFTASSMICIISFLLLKKKLDRLYQTIIYLVIIEGILYYGLFRLLG